MLNIILAESELELIPNEIISNPLITSYSKQHNKKPNNIILDSNFHHRAMQKLQEGNRRGRPDIAHIFLLSALESIANKKRDLNIIIHTRNNEAIYVNPETRIMRSFHRYIGLMEQLFEKNKIISEEKTLLELKKNKPLEKIIKELDYDYSIAFSQDAKIVKLPNYLKDLKKKNHKNILCIIGGFPSGDYHFNVSKHVDDTISIYNEMLTAWTVTNELIVNYENIYL